MNRCLVPPDRLRADGPAPLGPDAAHHLRDVLRVRPGDALRLLDGAGAARDARVVAVSKREVRVEPAGPLLALPPPAARLTLFQCVAKPARMDWLLEKIAELGVARLVPVLSRRVVAHLKPGDAPERWRRLLDAALCQCGGGHATVLAPAVDWAGALAQMAALGGPLFVGSLAPGAAPLGDALLARRDALRTTPVGWLVGPEGDFAPEELAAALALPNAVPVTFGPRVFRVETAALYGTAATLALAQGAGEPAGAPSALAAGGTAR